ncbi:hypothetical protein [Mesorhizobium sp.]|uniref:hypothetical protein n=1 Tax=Mesorhizobium sp. TaxID=1871066 RepID=UPI00257AD3CB|nr:hypothetical protein [Mesorhizobium sp.]
MSEPLSISDLIANWRTIGEFAADVGCGYEAARKMRDRESIAPEHWANVICASEAKGIPGVTYEWLAARRVLAAQSTGEDFDAARPGSVAAGPVKNPQAGTGHLSRIEVAE